MFFYSSGSRHFYRKSEFLLVLISLCLLLISHSYHTKGTWSPVMVVSASPSPYEIPLVESFPLVLGEAVSCKTCNMIVANTLRQGSLYKTAKKKDSLSHFEVDDFLEYTCNPYTSIGSWIRQLILYVVADDKNDDTQQNVDEVHIRFVPVIVEFVTKCNRGCATVQERCEYFLAQNYFDGLSRTIANMSEKRSPLFTEENYAYLSNKFCGNISFCLEEKMFLERATEELNEKGNPIRSMLLSDEVKQLEPSEYSQEFTAFNDLPGKRVTEPYTDDELDIVHELIAEIKETARKAKEAMANPYDESTCPWIKEGTDDENCSNGEKQMRDDEREDL